MRVAAAMVASPALATASSAIAVAPPATSCRRKFSAPPSTMGSPSPKEGQRWQVCPSSGSNRRRPASWRWLWRWRTTGCASAVRTSGSAQDGDNSSRGGAAAADGAGPRDARAVRRLAPLGLRARRGPARRRADGGLPRPRPREPRPAGRRGRARGPGRFLALLSRGAPQPGGMGGRRALGPGRGGGGVVLRGRGGGVSARRPPARCGALGRLRGAPGGRPGLRGCGAGAHRGEGRGRSAGAGAGGGGHEVSASMPWAAGAWRA